MYEVAKPIFDIPTNFGLLVELFDTFFGSVLIWSSIIQGGEGYFRHPDFSIGKVAVHRAAKPIFAIPANCGFLVELFDSGF